MDNLTHPKTIRRITNGRLAYYRDTADALYWQNHWRNHPPSPQIYQDAAQFGTLPTLMHLYETYLPRTGRILEAGCGIGDMVAVLRARGYEAEGVEWAQETVAAVQSVMPDLPIRAGDVTALNVPDGYYQGYISLGVVEHREAGPQPFFQEAYRVLGHGGIALIAVPYLNPVRAIKSRLGFYRSKPGSVPFYQYAYARGEMETLLKAAGFSLLDWTSYDGLKGLKDEMGALFNARLIGWRLKRWAENSPFAEHRLGHMQMIVAQKP